ncbi:hypothetical protein QCE73_25215 [Caballeronia sp. LZ029]|nr:hypothetical protein [Caballeronia sp. LZ029]MDR5746475.1 hypothetical protein [Caballeronia sp. LZ029]
MAARESAAAIEVLVAGTGRMSATGRLPKIAVRAPQIAGGVDPNF